MGLLTSPTVVNDGTNDRTFNFRSQLPSTTSIIGEYYEPAAVDDNSIIQVKHNLGNGNVRRSAVITSIDAPIDADGNTDVIVVTTSVRYHKKHARTDLVKALNVSNKVMGAAGVPANLIDRLT